MEKKPTAEKVADRLSGNGVVKAARVCIDLQVIEPPEPMNKKEARVGLDLADQEVIDNIDVFRDSRGKVEISPGSVLSEETSRRVVEELL